MIFLPRGAPPGNGSYGSRTCQSRLWVAHLPVVRTNHGFVRKLDRLAVHNWECTPTPRLPEGVLRLAGWGRRPSDPSPKSQVRSEGALRAGSCPAGARREGSAARATEGGAGGEGRARADRGARVVEEGGRGVDRGHVGRGTAQARRGVLQGVSPGSCGGCRGLCLPVSRGDPDSSEEQLFPVENQTTRLLVA